MATRARERHERWRRSVARRGVFPLLTCSFILVFFPLVVWSGIAQAVANQKCEKAKEIGFLTCENGGELHSELNVSRASCSRCDCPDRERWTGVDCSLCKSADVCPERDGVGASGCTWGGSVRPVLEELKQIRGKVLSCACGGDPQSEQYCAMQPFSYAIINLREQNKTNGLEDFFDKGETSKPSDDALPLFNMQITQFAGVPDMPNSKKYSYAYPVVWNATFSNCEHSVGDCYGPLDAEECDLIKCGDGLVDCPPPNVKKCPDWDPVGDCGEIPDSNGTRYWEFHCIPLAIPVNNSGTLFCERNANATAAGESKCYFYQDKSLFGQGIGMKCQTGNCLYNSTAPSPDPGPSHHSGYKVPALIATNLLFALVIGLFILSTGLFVYRETQKWQFERESIIPSGAEMALTQNLSSYAKCDLSHEFFLEWKIESYTIPQKNFDKQILNNVSGFVSGQVSDEASEPGRPATSNIFAILGPSGAGKTTLLDILAGRNTIGQVSGDIRVNGNPVTPQIMTQIAGYAPQSDILPGTSTVWEYLLFHANLRLPPTCTPAEKKMRVRDIILELGLMKVVDSFIGDEYTRGISGGEKKRVSVASELLHWPRILFLDEPTTGLDSTNAATMVEVLASLGKQGMIIVLSIHQPRSDIFRLMDRVLVLSCYGEMAYCGQAKTLETFLRSLDYIPKVPDDLTLADFMLDLVIKSDDDVVSNLVSDFKERRPFYWRRRREGETGLDDGLVVSKKYKASFRMQLKALSIRFLRNMYRHPFLVFLNLVCTLIFSVMIGVSYWKVGSDTNGIQNRMGCLFFILIYLALMSLSSIPIWRDQHVLYLRESAAQIYGTSAYFTAVVLFDILPMRIFPPCFFGFFSYWMVGLHKDCTFCLAYFLVILVLSNIASTMLSMAIGAASPSNRVANYVGSLAILILSLFGSFLMNRGDLHGASFSRWISNLSFLQYAYEALVVNEFHDSLMLYTLKVPIESLPPLRVNGDGVLKQFHYNVEGKYTDVMNLFLLSILHGLLGYLFLSLSGKHLGKKLGRKFRSWTSSCRQSTARESSGQKLLHLTQDKLAEVDHEIFDKHTLDVNSSFPFNFTHQRKYSAVSTAESDISDIATPMMNESERYDSDHILAEADRDRVLCLTWVKVSKTIVTNNSRLCILDHVSGIAGTRSEGDDDIGTGLFAILGPSGAGKTTLLDILAGRNTIGQVSGDIRVNGNPVTPQIMTQIAGYAPQSDILPGTSTVWEYLLFHANLRLPPTCTPAEKKMRVRDIILELGLMKVVDSFIGDEYTRGISGGEKKRVSVASELLHWPRILFLDEPTTGLDSTNAATMVEVLASLGKQGMIIVLSIQQPRSDIFRLMDRVLVLSCNGQMVYSGPHCRFLSFLGQIPYLPLKKEKENTADYILDIIIKRGEQEVNSIITSYQNSDVVKDENALLNDIYINHSPNLQGHREGKYRVGYRKQVVELSKRLLKNTIRQPFLVYLNFVSTAVIAVMLGIVYFKTNVDFGGIQNRMGSMFFIVLYLGLASLSSVPVWNENRLLFLRERASGAYSTFAYFTSMVLFDIIPMRIIPTCMFSLSYFMIGLSSTTDAVLHFPTFVIILVLTNASAVSMSMCIGACFPDTKIANAFASLAVLVSIMYGGFILSKHTMGRFSTFEANFSYMNFAFEALLINEFHGAEGYYFNSYADSKLRKNVTGDEILALFNFDANNLMLDIAALCMMAFTLFALCFLLLLRER